MRNNKWHCIEPGKTQGTTIGKITKANFLLGTHFLQGIHFMLVNIEFNVSFVEKVYYLSLTDTDSILHKY